MALLRCFDSLGETALPLASQQTLSVPSAVSICVIFCHCTLDAEYRLRADHTLSEHTAGAARVPGAVIQPELDGTCVVTSTQRLS